MASSIEVKGLTEFRRELGKLSKDLGDDLKDAHYKVAEFVSSGAKSVALGYSRAAAKYSSSIRPARLAKKAVLYLGSNSIPWGAGTEFGAKNFKQFPTYRRDGYFVYPFIKQNSDRIVDLYGDEVEKISKEAFPD